MTIRTAFAMLLVTGSTALAQPQFPQQQQPVRPNYSPYLNMLNNNNPAYRNYYGLVQPQIQAQNQLNNLQQQVSGLQNATQQATYGGTGGELSTGKQVGFFTHRAWFMNSNGYGGRTSLTGQYSNAGQNTINQPQKQTAAPPISNTQPFRR